MLFSFPTDWGPESNTVQCAVQYTRPELGWAGPKLDWTRTRTGPEPEPEPDRNRTGTRLELDQTGSGLTGWNWSGSGTGLDQYR